MTSRVEGPTGRLRVGQAAPSFELPGLDGGRVRLDDYRGKTVLLNFWATWCPPCKEEMPALEGLHREQRDRGVVVLAVNLGEDADTVGAYVRAGQFSFPVALDQDLIVSLRYETLGLPVSYFIDAEGILQDRANGALTRDQMDEKVARTKARAGKPRPTPSSVTANAGALNNEVVGQVGERRITLREVNERLDLQLALERLRTGAVLDIETAEGRAELERRRGPLLEDLVDEELLMRAAAAWGISAPDEREVDVEVMRLALPLGGDDALARELALHGVSLDYLRAVLQRGMRADAFANTALLTADAQGSPGEIIRRWLAQERARVGLHLPGL